MDENVPRQGDALTQGQNDFEFTFVLLPCKFFDPEFLTCLG